MTLEGTDTWVLAEPGAAAAVVVDPGPDDENHLRRVAEFVRDRGQRVEQILLTHRHGDHSGGAELFAELTGAPVRAADPAQRRGGGEDLAEGTVISCAGLELRVFATPGHTDDSVAIAIPADGALLTGDTILGRGTTVIASDGGDLGDYLASLTRLRGLAALNHVQVLLPGHGPLLPDAQRALDSYLAHRRERLAEVAAAVEAGARTPQEIVARVYTDTDEELLPAAESSVAAQLDYLRRRGVLPR